MFYAALCTIILIQVSAICSSDQKHNGSAVVIPIDANAREAQPVRVFLAEADKTRCEKMCSSCCKNCCESCCRGTQITLGFIQAAVLFGLMGAAIYYQPLVSKGVDFVGVAADTCNNAQKACESAIGYASKIGEQVAVLLNSTAQLQKDLDAYQRYNGNQTASFQQLSRSTHAILQAADGLKNSHEQFVAQSQAIDSRGSRKAVGQLRPDKSLKVEPKKQGRMSRAPGFKRFHR